MVEMSVSGVILEPKTRSPIVVLKDADERRALLIWVGEAEANAILMGLEKIQPPRPMTHDLLLNAVKLLNGKITGIRVSDMRDSTFFAEIDVEVGGEVKVLDARPSDAIALAMRVDVPIFVAEPVMATSSVPINPSQEEEDAEAFRKFLDEVKPSDFGKLGGMS
jgi:hypothetical protein